MLMRVMLTVGENESAHVDPFTLTMSLKGCLNMSEHTLTHWHGPPGVLGVVAFCQQFNGQCPDLSQ